MPILDELTKGNPGFIVAMWASSGDRKIVTDYNPLTKQVEYHNSGIESNGWKDKPHHNLLLDLSSTGANYVLHPARPKLHPVRPQT
jgi:hypothetical protein